MKIGKTTIITDSAKLSKKIDSLNKSAATITAGYHQAGLSAMVHARDHGDVGPCERLIAGMPNSFRVHGMIAWMVAHMPLVENEKGIAIDKDNPKIKLRKGRTEEDFKVEAAEAKPFNEFTKERKPLPYDREAFLKALVASTARLIKNREVTKEQAEEIMKGVQFVLDAHPVSETDTPNAVALAHVA